MKNKIEKVAVLGAGTMGAQIAGHLANAGIPSCLFDISQELAENGVGMLTSLKPAPLYKPKNSSLIEACNYDDHLEKIKDVKVSSPMGAFYCIVELPVKSAEDFSRFLLTDFQDDGQTVMLAPAAGFYSSPELGKNQVRLAFVLESNKLIRAAKILEKALIAYNNS